MTTKSPIHFFTDNDIPDSVGDFLRDSGHKVTRLREVMLTDTKDPVVAATCRANGLLLVTHNVRDFRKICKDNEVKIYEGKTVIKREFDSLNRIELACNQVNASDRMTQALDIIEAE